MNTIWCEGWVFEHGVGFQAHSRPCLRPGNHEGPEGLHLCKAHVSVAYKHLLRARKWADPDTKAEAERLRPFYVDAE